MPSARYWTVTLLMALATFVLYRRGDKDHVPVSTPLAQFPQQLDQRTSTDVPLDQNVLDVLGHGIFLNRVYSEMPGRDVGDAASAALEHTRPPAAVALFIAYFPTQRTGQSIHSPQNCLPGAGWVFESAGVTEVKDATGRASQVGDYIISDGTNRDEVLYWYQSHGRAIASDYRAKLYMLADSIRYSRSDAALVRIVTPITGGEPREVAHERAVEFASRLIPLLPAYIPN